MQMGVDYFGLLILREPLIDPPIIQIYNLRSRGRGKLLNFVIEAKEDNLIRLLYAK